jgi:hypothetical protein
MTFIFVKVESFWANRGNKLDFIGKILSDVNSSTKKEASNSS